MPSLHCPCGGRLDFSTDPQFGRSIEVCRGACGYSGALRPDVSIVPQLACNRVEILEGEKPCCDCHERPTYTEYAQRCQECADARHRLQKLAAACRSNARIARRPNAPAVMRGRKRRPVDTQGAAIGAQRVTSEAV